MRNLKSGNAAKELRSKTKGKRQMRLTIQHQNQIIL
jgi:hypothetical protein